MPSIKFNQIIPDSFNPTLPKTIWTRYVEDMPSVNDGVFSVLIGGSTPDFMIRKGLTHISKFDLQSYPQNVIDDIISSGRLDEGLPPITPIQLSLPDYGTNEFVPVGAHYSRQWNTKYFGPFTAGRTEPLTPEQATAKGNQYNINANIIIFENSESLHSVGDDLSFWHSYYTALKARLDAKWINQGKKYYLAHNYFSGLSNRPDVMQLGQSSREAHKELLEKPLSQWPSNPLLNGSTRSTNTGCFGLYLGAPDLSKNEIYKLIYASWVHQIAGKQLLVYASEQHEWFPNNLHETVYTEGKFYRYDKIPMQDGFVATMAILSRIFADGWCGWLGKGGESPVEPPRFSKEHHSGLWYPNGSTEPANSDTFPHWITAGQKEIFQEQGVANILGFAMHQYMKTFGQTKGGVRRYLKYRIGGGNWITPVNHRASDVVDAFFDKRGIVFAETKGNDMSIFYLNPYADNTSRLLEFEHPTNGTIYSVPVAGTCIHVTKITV